jgi:V/A-type H+-transporting ATPase subunit I
MLADAMAHYGKLKFTYLIVGWVPSAKVPALTDQLKKASPNIIIDATPSREGDNSVPTALRNPGFLGAFEMLVNTYARPRYEEIDPTVLIGFTFPLLFGMMFGDVGQGVIVALFGLLIASKSVPALRSMASLGTIVTMCGIFSTVFGFIYGSFFGKEGEENILIHSFPALHNLVLIEPLHQPIVLLGIAVGVGVVILSAGFLLNLYNASRAKDWPRFWFDHKGVVGLTLYWSLIGFAAASFLPNLAGLKIVFVILIVVGAIGVTFSEVFKHMMEGHGVHLEGGPVMFAIQAGVELFEVFISLFSNTLSYARLGGFALAHAGLSIAVYIIADLFGAAPGVGGLLWWIVAILGNLFIIGFEGMIVGIQTMRLHYYEFFSKFFTGGGAPYEPLAPLQTQPK